jgi:hypothetical protein
MKIPQVRDRLRELAVEHGIDELEVLADELRRRPPVRVTPPRSSPMTEELRIAIRAYWIARPNASNQEIATVFGVNPGRVSESLAGLRT